MHPSRLLLAALVLASAPAFAEEPMDAPPRGPVFEATNDPVKLKQQAGRVHGVLGRYGPPKRSLTEA